jgi:uncharacterized protein (TIGR03437 family)
VKSLRTFFTFIAILCFLPCALWAQHSTVPVVLVDGYSLCAPAPTLESYFGNLGAFLNADGAPVHFFENCAYGALSRIDQLGSAFGQFLATLGTGPVDVIAHSMGGLIVRSYLAGLNLAANTVSPPLNPPIRKLVFIATPHFGTDFNWPFDISGQTDEMQYGSELTWDLATWNQQLDDLRGIDSIAIAGNDRVDPDGIVSDGLVAVSSASLDFARSNSTRVIPYCHAGGLAQLVCIGPQIAFVDSRTHLAYQIIRSFLDGNSAWQSIGVSPAQATNRGGMLWNAFDANSQLMAGLPAQLTSAGVSHSVSSGAEASYVENAYGSTSNGSLTFSIPGQSQSWVTSAPFISPGAFKVWITKFGPNIYTGGVRPAAGVPPGPVDVAGDSLISIYGSGLATTVASAYPWVLQLAGTTVTIDGSACLLYYAGPSQVNALVPPNLAFGRHLLRLQNSQGQQIFTLMIDPIVPALFSSAGYASALHSNYQPVSSSNPAARGEIISLYATGLGPVTAQNGLQYANAIPKVLINGVSSEVTFAGRAPGFQGLDQINVQIPAGVSAGSSIPVVVVSGNRTSNQVLLPIK